MIPEGGTIKNAPVEEVQQPSSTWHMDLKKGKITGRIDEAKALEQTIFQILLTERFQYMIYSFNYGNELQSLIGESPLFIQSEGSRMIREALVQDDRINTIHNIKIEIKDDSFFIRFFVDSVYGSFSVEQEVIRGV